MRWHWREGAMIARAVIGSGEMQNRRTGVSPPRRRHRLCRKRSEGCLGHDRRHCWGQTGPGYTRRERICLMPNILCYGDSNTHGTEPLHELGMFSRYPRGIRWPDVMATRLGPAFDVISEGLNGRTTVHHDYVEGGKRSGLEVLPAILLSHTPLDLLVIMLGTNDLKPRFSVTAFEIARSVERLVNEARHLAPGLDIMVLSPAPLEPSGCLIDAFDGAFERQRDLAAHLCDMAERQSCGFVDAGAHLRVSPIDGVHWSAEAHQTFGVAMADAVTARLGAQT